MKRYVLVDSSGKKLLVWRGLLDIILVVIGAYALRVLAYAFVSTAMEIPYLRVRYILYLYPIHLTTIAEVVWFLSALIIGSLILLWEFSRTTEGEDDILDDLNQ